MKVYRLTCVLCIFISSLFSAYTFAMKASVMYAGNIEPRFNGIAYVFKCQSSFFPKDVWNMKDLLQKDPSKAKKNIICCISKEDVALFAGEPYDKDLKSYGCFLKYEDVNAEDSQKLYLSHLYYRKSRDFKLNKPKYLLTSMMRLYQYYHVNHIPITEKENLFLESIIITLGNIADISLKLMADYLVANPYIKNEDDKVDEIVNVLILTDNRASNIYNITDDNKEYQSMAFPCLIESCSFSDISWGKLYEHMRLYHKFKYPSIVLSRNKLNDKNRKMNIFNENTDCVLYIPCQACLAESIQDYVNHLKSHSIQPSFSLITKDFLKPKYNINQIFSELGYGSIEAFIQRHMIML